ncbi:MAG: DUF2325 domain-containing protein [Clostridia bacterium]|nr:DUF2325 domain-containing protein [Clostridia bacterium]
MSVVIVGGHECMVRQYKELCNEYNCKAKVYSKMNNGLKGLGTPDLLVLFTGTVSHKALYTVMKQIKGQKVKVARAHSGSIAALKTILREHTS